MNGKIFIIILGTIISITAVAATAQSLRSRSTTPDRKIAYLLDKDIHIVSANTRGDKKSTNSGDIFRIFDQRPDGAVLYGRNLDHSRDTDTTFSTTLWQTDADGKNTKLVDKNVMDAKFFPNGQDVLYRTDDAELYLRSGDGKSRIITTKAADASISPDGKKLVYLKLSASWERGQYGDDSRGIYKFDLTTGQETILTDSSLDFQPNWSPDEQSIVFASGRTSLASVWMMDSDGKNQRQITNVGQEFYDADVTLTAPGQAPLWTADKRHLVYESDRKIMSLEIDDARKKLVKTTQLGFGEQPAMIDGQTVAFVATPSSNTSPKILKINVEGNVIE